MKKIFASLLALAISSSMLIAQTPVATIPMEVYGDHTFIKVQINGSEDLDYILDTGDGLAILNINDAAKLGISSGEDETITSAEGSISGKRVKHNEFTVGGAPIHNVELHETDLSHLEISIGRNIDGIIGYDLLKNYVVSIDYDQMKIELYEPKSYSYKGTGSSYAIKLSASKNPHIKGKTVFANGETIEGDFFVDTGAKATVDYNTPYVEKNGLAKKIGDSYIYLVAGLGKTEYEHHKGKVQSFSFGSVTIDNMPVGLSHAKHGIQNHKKISGIIGGALLKKFNIVMDYSRKKMYLEKNASFDKPFMMNASGLELQLSKDKSKVLVHKVFDNSPAQSAGIAVDAVIESINGKNAVELGLAKSRKILAQSGESVELMIDGKSVKLDLKYLL